MHLLQRIRPFAGSLLGRVAFVQPVLLAKISRALSYKAHQQGPGTQSRSPQGAADGRAAPPTTYKDIKQVLKKFLKEVHPDRFAKYPEQQAVNERSLADLNAFIDSVEGSQPLPRCSISLEFYRLSGETRPTKSEGKQERARPRRLRYTLDLDSDARYRSYLKRPQDFATQCLRRLLERAELLEPAKRPERKREAQRPQQPNLRAEMEAAFAKDLPYMHERKLGSKARPRRKPA